MADIVITETPDIALTINSENDISLTLADSPSISIELQEIGLQGPQGPQGEPGVGEGGTGVPAGGTAGQALTKNSNTDYDITWSDVDGTLRTDLATTGAGKGAEMVAFKQTGMGAIDRTVSDKLRESASVKDFGAIGDGDADDGPAFLAWMAHLNLNAPIRGHIPFGRYNLTSITGQLNILSGGISIDGDGSASTVLVFGYAYSLFAREATVPGTANCFGLSGVTLEGPASGVAVGGYAKTPILINNVSSVLFDDVKITKCPALAVATRNCERIIASNCSFEEIARGGLNFAESRYTSITGCRFFKLGDDAISLHERQGSMQISQHAISGNTFFMSQGIKGLGTRNVSATGNTFEFMLGNAFFVSTESIGGPEGSNATVNVVFSGNTVKDTFNNIFVSSANQNRSVVVIGGRSANAYGLDAVPTYPNAAGAIIRPEPYTYSYSSATSPAAVPPSGNIVISNNTVVQTLPSGVAFSTLGFGSIFGHEGVLYNPTIGYDTLMGVDFLRVEGGYVNNAVVSNNVVAGAQRAAFFFEGPAEVLRIRNMVFTGNLFYNLFTCGFEFSSNLDFYPDALDVSVSNNLFDVDPYLANSNRNADGSWVAYGTASTPGIIFMARGNNLSQIRFQNNTIKNALGVGTVSLKDNLFICDVATINSFSTSNKGVGFVPYGEQVMLVDSTPTSPTYGSLINAQLQFSNSAPSTGKYVAGHTVRNTQPNPTGTAGSRYVIKEWLRLTTGTSHVNGTDWIEQRTLTGT